MRETEKILQTKGYSLEQAIELLNKVGEGKIKIGKTITCLESELDEESASILKLFVGY